MSDNLNKRPVTLEDIHSKLEKLFSLVDNMASELPYIASDASTAKVMLEDLAKHFGLSDDEDDEDDSHDE